MVAPLTRLINVAKGKAVVVSQDQDRLQTKKTKWQFGINVVCCCSMATACLVIGIVGVISSFYGIITNVHWISGKENKLKLKIFNSQFVSSSFAYVNLILGAFGLVAFSFLIYSSVKKSEKLLIPALMLIPIKFLSQVILSILTIQILGGISGMVTSINIISALIYVPVWIAIFSFRQELQEYELIGNGVRESNKKEKNRERGKNVLTLICCFL